MSSGNRGGGGEMVLDGPGTRHLWHEAIVVVGLPGGETEDAAKKPEHYDGGVGVSVLRWVERESMLVKLRFYAWVYV